MNDANEELGELVDHLTRMTRLDRSEARKVVVEVVAFFAESTSDYIARRHSALRAEGLANAAIYGRLALEIERRRFAAPALSERQIRRLIYG